MRHTEHHRVERIGWLRAAVMGANDGVVSTASLVLGVAAAEAGRNPVLVAGVAGVVAGAMSMAAGEYVSVQSQADLEAADREREREELETEPESELAELTAIYVARGLDAEVAAEVARQMTAHDALGTHLRDELGLTEQQAARPIQAALASAGFFTVGGVLPLGTIAVAPVGAFGPSVAATSLGALALLGGFSARMGGARVAPAIARVVFWGALAMAATSGVGALFGMAL